MNNLKDFLVSVYNEIGKDCSICDTRHILCSTNLDFDRDKPEIVEDISLVLSRNYEHLNIPIPYEGEQISAIFPLGNVGLIIHNSRFKPISMSDIDSIHRICNNLN